MSAQPVRRNTWMIKAALFIFTFFLCFCIYIFGNYDLKAMMVLLIPRHPTNTQLKKEPTQAPFKDESADDIKHSIWNDLPETGNFSSVESSSSGQHSVVSLEQPRAQYYVGDTLNVLVNMKDYRGIPKAYGGDFILARIHSPELQASASGEVTDLRNGSYRVRFHLFWPGIVRVSVLLMHSSEAVGILKRISENNYNKIIYTGTFYNGSEKEESQCGVRMKRDQALCEYRKKEDAEYYACVRPKTLPCSALKTMRSRNGPIPDLSKEEYLLLSRKNTGIPIRNSFGPVKVIINQGVPLFGFWMPADPLHSDEQMPRDLFASRGEGKETFKTTEKCVVGFGMMSPSPSCYFFKNRWVSSSCQNGNFFSADAISKCLKGRTLKLMGDSTVRQWQESLRNIMKDLEYVRPYDTHYFARAVGSRRNMTVQWKMHGHPFVTGYNIVKDMVGYVARELDRVEDGDVVVIGVGQHFRPFPPEIFIQRLINIRKAILRLLERSPQTLVVIKVENTRELSSDMTHLSDWFGYLQNLAQRKVFRDLKVVLVDAWDITTAASTFAIHPNNIIVSNEIAQALSYLCHDV